MAVSFVISLSASACSDPDPTPEVVQPADAYTAIVEWQIAEQEPILDDKGNAKLPVIYVVAADGATVDAGVQAAVAASTVDDAIVRFADDVSDGFDAGLEGSPVHDDGVMLAVGTLPEPSRTIDVELARFLAEDDYEQFSVEITLADTRTAGTESNPTPAEVTSVTPR